MPLPKVSIAIPAYNRENLVQRVIESALAQTYPDIEVVVVDNFSTDNTNEVVQKYARIDSRVRCFRNERNIGPVPNWWRCVKLSRGQYLKILFSDDWMEPTAVERLIEPFQEYEGVAFTYSSVLVHLVDEAPRVLYQRLPGGLMPSIDFLWESAVWGSTPVSPCAALFRRSDVIASFTMEIPSRASIDCNQYGIGNDAILYWKGCERYPNVYHIPEPLIHFAEAGGDEPGFTMSLLRSGQGQVLARCYQSAFGYFLATSNLPTKTKRLLHTGMFLKRVPFRPWSIRPAIWEFQDLFPKGYRWWHLRFSDQRILKILKSRMLHSLRRTLLQGTTVSSACEGRVSRNI